LAGVEVLDEGYEVSRLTNTPEALTRAELQKRPGEGTY
jgi:hypothetical protein